MKDFKQLVKDRLEIHQIDESIKKPTSEHKSTWRSKGRKGKLYFVVMGEKGKVLGYIDSDYLNKHKKKDGKKMKPMDAAKMRLRQIEYFKKN